MDAGGDPEAVLIDGNSSWRSAVSEALEARGLAVFDTDADLDDVLEEIARLWAPVSVVGPAVVGNVLRTVAMISALDASMLVLHRQDHGTAEIAARLVVSPVTVRTHILALRQKLARTVTHV